MILNIGESKTFSIRAKAYWNDTNLEIHAGEKYAFFAKGKWIDLIIRTNADGYTSWYMKLFNKFKRAQGYKWFALMGSLDKKNFVLLGRSSQIEFKKSGVLSCFANDAKRFYSNNCGTIELRITRIE